jgi:hypothetical protein
MWIGDYNPNQVLVVKDFRRLMDYTVYGTYPNWKFPLIRKDALELLLRRRYWGAEPLSIWESVWERIPVFEHRGSGGRYSYYDLRIVARFAPRPALPSLWRCLGCREKMFRKYTDLYEYNNGGKHWYGWVCSSECNKIALKRALHEESIKTRRREREWMRIKQCRKLLKEARAYLRNRGA